MKRYRLKNTLPCGGTSDGYTYRLEEGPDPSGFGHALFLRDSHLGFDRRHACVTADTRERLERALRVVGFTASGEAEITLDHLVRQGLAEQF